MTSKHWKLYPPSAGPLAADLGVPPLVAQVLSNRRICDPATAAAFLSEYPSPLHDPFLLPDMDRAVDRLAAAADRREKVGVFGDFDADGVTATAILTRALEGLGAKVAPYIPHRVAEGHGLNKEALQALKHLGASMVVTVDCGVTSVDEVDFASELGLDVVITDHHTPAAVLPAALATIDPKVPASRYPFDELTGAGLALKLATALYQRLERRPPDDLLALAAIGTVADLAPLLDENRSLVRRGLAELRQTENPGLRALCRSAGVEPGDVTSETIGFAIAPRLNASGRVRHAQSSYRLLTTGSEAEAESLAAEIESFNRERRRSSEAAFRRAAEKVDAGAPILLVADEEIPPGVAGLAANRLVDLHHRPAVVMSLDGQVVRASARSIDGFNIIAALERCRELFQRHGGHPMAAGFVMDRANLGALRTKLTAIAAEALGDAPPPSIAVDAEATPSALMGETRRLLESMEPFGQGNRRPVFLARNMRLLDARTMGRDGSHLRFKLHDGLAEWDAVAFGQGGGVAPRARVLDLVYTLMVDTWRGRRSLKLRVADFRPTVRG